MKSASKYRRRFSVPTVVTALVLAMLAFVPAAPSRAAGIGDVDGAFGDRGTMEVDFGGLDISQASVVDAAGRIVTVGWSQDTPDHATVSRTLPVDPTQSNDGKSDSGFRDPSFTPDAAYATGSGFQMISDIPWDAPSSTSKQTRFTDVVIDTNGRIVIVGTVQDGAAPGARQGLLVRLNPNGTLDTSFGGGDGGVIFDMYTGASDNQVQGVTLAPDGGILVAGGATLSGSARPALARFVNPGSLDANFNSGGGDPGRFIEPSANTNAAYTDVLIKKTDLSIYAVGTGFNGTDTDAVIARLDSTGAFIGTGDYTFGDSGTPTTVTAAKLDSANRLVVVGRAQRLGATVGFITRLNTTAGLPLDMTWIAGGSARLVNLAGGARTSFEGLTIQPDGTYVVAAQLGTGSGGDDYDIGLYAITASTPAVVVALGNQQSTTGLRQDERALRHFAAVNDFVRDIVTQADGKVVVAGDHIHQTLVRFLTAPSQGTDAGSPVLSYSTDGTDDSFGMKEVRKLVADTDKTWLAGDGASGQFHVATQPAAGGTVTTLIDGIPRPAPATGNFAASNGYSIARGLDGTIIAAGTAGTGANGMSPTFVRFKADGSLDPTFGAGGVVVVPRTNPYDSNDNIVDDAVVNDVAVLPDGKIVGVGFWQTPSGDPQDLYVVRLNSDGSLDPTFDGSGEYHGVQFSPSGATDDLDGVVVHPDGSFTAVGREQLTVGTSDWVIVVRHYSAAGVLGTSIQVPAHAFAVPAGPNSLQVHGATLGPDSRLYVVGDFGGCTNSSDRAAFVQAFKPDLSGVDTNFGSSGLIQYCTQNFETAYGVAVAPDGDVVIAGGSGPSGQSASLTRYDSAGHPDMSFGVASAQTYLPPNSGFAGFEAVGIRDDGTIVGAGMRRDLSFNSDGFVGQAVGDPAPALTDFGPTGRVVFDSTQSGHTDLWTVDSSGARLEQVTTQANQPGRMSYDPTFSKDGREIAFTSVSDTNPFDANIRKRTSGGGFLDLASDVNAYEADPDWSADGTKIAFVSDDNGPSYGNLGVQPFDIWVMNADGTGKTAMTSGSAIDQFPAWSADGSKLLFQRANGAIHDLWFRWMTGPNAGSFQQVTSGIDAGSGSWGVNGEIVYTDATVNAPRIKVCYMLPDNAGFTAFHRACSASAPGNFEDADAGVYVPTSDPARPATVQYSVGNGAKHRLDSINSTDGALRTIVDVGTAVIGHSDWVENLTVTTSATATAASPASIPVGYVPVQSDAAAVKSQFDGAGLPALSLLKSGLPALSLLKSGLPILSLIKSPLPALSLLKSGLPILSLIKSPLPALSLLKSGLPILSLIKSPVANGLRQTSLAEMTLDKPGGWQQFNADIPELAGRPTQSLTLLDELTALQAHPTHPTFMLSELSYQGTPFASVSAVALTLAQMPVSSINKQGVNFCTYVPAHSQGFGSTSCSEINSMSLLDLQVAGVDLGDLNELEGLTVGNLSYPATAGAAGRPALADFKLADMQLDLMNLGTVALSATPNRSAITTCTTCATLADAFSSSNGIKSTAIFSDLGHAADDFTIAELVTGFLPSSYSPIDRLPADQLGIEGYNGAGPNESSKLSYAVDYSPLNGLASSPSSGLAFTVELPANFRYISGSAALSRNGASIGAIHPTRLSGNRLMFAVPRALNGLDLLHLGFDVRPGLDLAADQTVGVRVASNGIDQQVHNRAAVDVQDIFEPANDTTPGAPAIDSDRLYLNHSQTGTDVDFSVLKAPGTNSTTLAAGTTVTMILTQGGGDADLVIYGPPGLASGQALRRTNANATPIVPVGDPGSLRNSGEPLTPETLNDIQLANLPVVGISTNRGTTNDIVTFTAPVAGTYRAEVIPFNHLASPKTQTMRFTATPPATPAACVGRSGYSAGLASRPAPTAASVVGKTTLFLVNRGRLAASYTQAAVDTMTAKLNELAARPEVNGAVVDLDGFAAVRSAYATWDANSCSVDAANGVVRAINDAVDSLYGANGLSASSVDNVILVGNDEMLPMARIPDLTQQTNQRAYAGALAFTGTNNAMVAAFTGGYQLVDDPYGDKSPSPYLGRYLYVSDTTLSRLGETPSEITAYAQSYVDANGRLDRASAVTAGYDFMRDLASDVHSSLGRSVSNRKLLNDNGSDGADPFTRANAASAIDANPDVASFNGHYDHAALLPGVSSGSGTSADMYTTANFDSSSASDRSRSLFFTMGCDSGVSVADILIANPNTAQAARLRDWAQAMAAHKATYVGQTGYGVGLKYTVALSEKILSDFAKNLTTTGTSVGDALRLSKQHYVGSIGVYGVYDEKVLNEAVLYGLPFWTLPGGVAATPPPANPATQVDPFTGLDSFGFAANPTFSTHDTGTDGKYLTATQADAISSDPLTIIGRPMQPKLELDVTQPSKRIADALITELTSDDTMTGFNPVIAGQVIDDSSHEAETDSTDVLFPATIVGSSQYSDRFGPRHSVVVVPGQFKATGSQSDGQTIGVQRKYTHVAGLAYFSSSLDRIRPVIASTALSRVGQGVAFSVNVSDLEPGPTPETPLPGGIKRVVVLAHDETSAEWHRAELTRDAFDPTHYTGGLDLSGNTVEYLVQAVDNNGNVAPTTSKNFFASPAIAPPPPAGITATASGPATPDGSSGWTSDALVTLSGPAGVTFTYLIDGGGLNGSTTPISYGAPFHITDEGSHRVDWTSSNGKSGYVLANVDTASPTVTILSPTTARVRAGSHITPVFRCDDTGSGIDSCDVIAGGDENAVDTDSANADTAKTFKVKATDLAGRTATGTVSFVADGTSPVITLTTPKADGSSVFAKGSDPEEAVTCTDNGASLPCSVPTIDTGTLAQSRDYSVTATDSVGNSTTAQTHYRVALDAPPTVTITTPVDGKRYKAGSSVTPEFACGDVGWGVTSCVVTSGGTASVLDTTSPNADTAKTFTVKATDSRGITATKSVSYVADGTKPVITLNNPKADGSSKFDQGENAIESVDCTDGSGPEPTCTIPKIVTTTIGTNFPYSVTATDSVGNTATASTNYAVALNAAPHIEITTPVPDQRVKAGTTVAPVFHCDDVGWGVVDCKVTGSSSATGLDTNSPNADTIKTFTVEAKDTKGRVSTLSINYVADGTAPIVTLLNPKANGSSQYETGSNPAENVTCTDGNGPAPTCPVPQIDTSATGTFPYSVTSTDAVGNSATASTQYKVADASLPGVYITTPAQDQPFKAGASVTPVFGCTDTGWGVKSCVVTAGGSATALDTVSPNADTVKTFEVIATDNAGRTRTKSVTYLVDGTAPIVTLTNPKADGTSVYAAGVAATPAATCTDGGVIIPCTIPAIDTSTATPSRTYSVTATDAVGNVTTVLTHYAVANPTGRFEGWFAPVQNRPAVNNATVLSTVPIRFRIYDRFDAVVTDPTVVRSASRGTIACPGSPLPSVGITINIPPQSGTTSWSAPNNWFEYPFATQVGWLLSCQRFSMTFDPSLGIPTQTADFKFTPL